MSCNTSPLNTINEELGDNFDNLIERCKTYREVLLKRNHDISENVSIEFVLYFYFDDDIECLYRFRLNPKWLGRIQIC